MCVCVCVCVEDFDIKRKITHFFYPLRFFLFFLFSLLSLPRDVRSLLECFIPEGGRIRREKETCFFFFLFFSFQNPTILQLLSIHVERPLMPEGNPKFFPPLSHSLSIYWEVSFFSFLLFLPLLLVPSVQVRRLWRLDHFFLSNTREIIYLFIICFCGNVLSVPTTVVERLSNK